MGRHKKTRYCIECGAPLPESRADRLYCCNACKSHHFYETKQMNHAYRQNVIESLERNRTILMELIRKKVDSVELMELLPRGFSPVMMTCCRRKARYSECGCFDISYNMAGDTRLFHLRRKKGHNVPYPVREQIGYFF